MNVLTFPTSPSIAPVDGVVIPDSAGNASDTLAAALEYAEHGWPIHPCKAKDKRPHLDCDRDENGEKIHGTGGHKKASTGPELIQEWWQQWPDALAGLVTGEASGLWCLDLDKDPDKGFDAPQAFTAALTEDQKRDLLGAPQVITPRGGRHMWFRTNGATIPSSANEVKVNGIHIPGIDVRGEGAYAIVPPGTRSDGKKYELASVQGRTIRLQDAKPAPAWLVKMVKDAVAKDGTETTGKRKKAKGKGPKAYVDATLRNVCERLAKCQQGGRNEELNKAAFALGQLLHTGLLTEERVREELEKSAAACGLTSDGGRHEVKTTIDSGLRAGQGKPRDVPSSVTDEGNLRPNLANALTVLRSDPEVCELFAYDQMASVKMLMAQIPGGTTVDEPRVVRDEDVYQLLEWFQSNGFPTMSKEAVYQAVAIRALERSFHPVRQYLDGLVWDKTPRVETWLSDYLGSEKSPYTSAIGKMFLLSMVARIYKPGCKVDYMLILESPQGDSKSAVCSILANPWFSDSLPVLENGKDVSQHLRGHWLIEIGEMYQATKADSNLLKQFLTRTEEIYRPPYGREIVHEPRQTVFIATTNKASYLKDETGGRRFWPVKTPTLNIEKLKADRDQLFAEAVVLFRKGAKWWPDREFEKEHIQPQQEQRYQAHGWEDYIHAFVEEQKAPFRTGDVGQALGFEKTTRLGPKANQDIADILTRLGYELLPKKSGQTFWWKKGQETPAGWKPPKAVTWNTGGPDMPF